MESSTTDLTYLFDNAADHTRGRFSGLEEGYDPSTFRHLQAVGIGAGWHCLEVGAGGGSVARWMSDRVGPTGSVLAVDLDPRWVREPDRPNLEVRRLDLRVDELPAARFDLIHARLVLAHLPERADVLVRLVRSLTPGGWLVISEFDPRFDACPDPRDETQALLTRVSRSLCELLELRGADLRYGSVMHQVFASAGLTDVRSEGHLESAPGRSPFARIQQANLGQVRGELTRRGMATDAEIDRFLAALDDPSVSQLTPVMFTCRGRRAQLT